MQGLFDVIAKNNCSFKNKEEDTGMKIIITQIKIIKVNCAYNIYKPASKPLTLLIVLYWVLS